MHYYPIGVLTVSWLTFLFDNYLTYRQYKVVKATQKVPKELASFMDSETLEKARAYSLDKTKFGFITGIIGQIQSTLKITYYLMPFFWNLSAWLMTEKLNLTKSESIWSEICQSLIFTIMTSILTTLINMPLTVYYNFVIEERHGFNKQTWRFFVWDQIKVFLVNMIMTTPILIVMIYIVRFGGPYFFLYLWGFIALVTALIAFFSGELMAIFDKIVPLPEGELRSRIEELAKSIKFNLAQVYLVEGSKRSSHSNAYQAGIFNKKRIVLYDTLLKDYTKPETEGEEISEAEKKKRLAKNMTFDEIIAVVCHELGHWHCGHLMKNLLFSQANLFMIFMIFSRFYKDSEIYKAFGFEDMPVMIGLILVMMILSPYLMIEGFVQTFMSRKFEYEADAFAKKQGYAADLKTGLVKLHSSNLGFPVYDELYSMFTHSHPTTIQRLKALDKTD